jgi:hypothetical protein
MLTSAHLPMDAFCQKHSWAWASISNSKDFRAGSVSSEGMVAVCPIEDANAGTTSFERYWSTPAAFWLRGQRTNQFLGGTTHLKVGSYNFDVFCVVPASSCAKLRVESG